MFYRSFLGKNLTPAERAIVRFVEGMIGVAALAAGTAIVQVVATSQVDVATLIKVALSAAFIAAWQAILKYLRAQLDVPLAPVAPVAPASGAAGDMPAT